MSFLFCAPICVSKRKPEAVCLRLLRLKQGNLAGFREVSECAGCLEVFNVRLRNLRAGERKLLDGQKCLALAPVHDVPGGGFAETRDGDERRKKLAVFDYKACGVRAVEVDGREGKAAQIKFIADLQRGKQVVILCRRILRLVNLLNLLLDQFDAVRHH